MNRNLIVGAVAFVVGGIIAKSVKTALDIRRENTKEITEGP